MWEFYLGLVDGDWRVYTTWTQSYDLTLHFSRLLDQAHAGQEIIVAKAGSYRVPHRDPFDRMLAAQSALEGVKLVTRDPSFKQFGTDVYW
jgi:PIN domain nuclease of toxin-antitoxin system